jgi:hypothetical protein
VESTTIRQTADQKLISELQERTLRPASRDRLKKVASQEQVGSMFNESIIMVLTREVIATS